MAQSLYLQKETKKRFLLCSFISMAQLKGVAALSLPSSFHSFKTSRHSFAFSWIGIGGQSPGRLKSCMIKLIHYYILTHNCNVEKLSLTEKIVLDKKGIVFPNSAPFFTENHIKMNKRFVCISHGPASVARKKH